MFVYDDVVYAQTWQVLILKNCMEPFSCASSAYVVASALVSVRLFCKNLGKLQKFFGQMVYRPTPPHPLAKIARTPMFIINFCTCSMYFCCFVLVYSNSRHVVWMIIWTVDKNYHDPISDKQNVIFHLRFQIWAPFLERTGNFLGPNANF